MHLGKRNRLSMDKENTSTNRVTRLLNRICSLLCLWMVPLIAAGQFDHELWDNLLKEHLLLIDGGKATQVDYSGMAQDRQQLQEYLGQIAAIERASFDRWSKDEQLAFLINTYNAWTVELILSEYPLRSIRSIGFLPGAAWRRDIVSLFGEQVSLDDVEHGMIRGWGLYKEPRIHFAVNCAAIGCPALRAEAYQGDRLQQQLEDSTRLFLSDRQRNYLADDAIYVSRIFNWYEEDFEQGWTGIDSVQQFLAEYAIALGLGEEQRAALLSGDIALRYLRYDWGLNDTDS